MSKVVQTPQNTELMQLKVAEFEEKYSVIKASGCIDGTHIAKTNPYKNFQNLHRYIGYHSFNVQAVCDTTLTVGLVRVKLKRSSNRFECSR